MYRFGLETDGRPAQPPFPPVDVVKIVHGLENLIGADQTTSAAEAAPTVTDHQDPVLSTSEKQPNNTIPVATEDISEDISKESSTVESSTFSQKQPENTVPVPVPTEETVKDSPKFDPSTTVAAGMSSPCI